MSDLNYFLGGGENFKKTEFNAKFYMVLKQANQTWMKKVLKISQMTLDISPKVFLTPILSKLYNILFEIKDLFTFHVNNYKNHSDFLRDLDSNNIELDNSIIVVDKQNNQLFLNKFE